MAWIYDKNGQQKCEIKKLSYNGTFMEVSSITVTVETPEPIAFSIGDYIDWSYDGLRYTLDDAAGVEKQARKNSVGNAFVYDNLVFLSPLNAADHVDFLDVVLGNTNEFLTNTEFSFYGTAWDYAKRLEANLCRLYGSGTWKVRIWTGGTCYDSSPATNLDTGAWENKLVDVSGMKCLGGFSQIYDLWGCAYVFSVVSGVNYVDFYDDFEQYARTWKVGDVDKIFAYGKGNGLYKIRHTPDSDHVLVTRLRAYGSGENIPANYYLNSSDYHVAGNESSELAISHLMLPASEWTKNSVKSPANAYLEANTDLYGVREGVVLWDGSDEELGEIKPTIYGLTIQDLLDAMASGTTYRPVEAKWPDTTQRIDKIIVGTAPTDNGTTTESGYDFTVVEGSGATAAGSLSTVKVNTDVDFSDIVMSATPSVSHLAEFRIVPTGSDDKFVSFDVPSSVVSGIRRVNATLTPYVGGVMIEDSALPCAVVEETISETVGGVSYTKRYYVRLVDSAENPIVFSTMYTGAVTFSIRAHINFRRSGTDGVTVLRNEYAVSFNLLRGSKVIDKFFSVTIPQIGFDLAAAVTNGAKLCMRSGDNQPREFTIVPASVRYLEDSDTWYVRCKRSVDQSIKTYFPNSNSVIATGDEYYLTGTVMPALYVEIAAQKLLSAATAWLQKHSKPRMLSSVDVDNKIMAVEGIVLKEGMALPITDTDLGITTSNQESRIIDNIRIEEGSDAIRTFSITLRDKKEKSSLDAAIRGATSDFVTSSSVTEAVSAAENRDHGSLSGRDMPNQHPISAITGLENQLASLTFFEEDGSGNVKLKEVYGGLWTSGQLAAGGIYSNSGGGGIQYLWALLDVKKSNGGVVHEDGTAVDDGDILVYGTIGTNVKGWYAAPQPAGSVNSITLNGTSYAPTSGVIALPAYAGGSAVSLNGVDKSGSTASIYAPTGAGTSGQYLSANGFGVPSWTSNGSIASGNTGLVDGGTVYSELLSYLAKSDFLFDIVCKGSLGDTENLNTVFDKTITNLKGKFSYYAYVGRDSNSGTAGLNGFPASTNANALLTIGTYSDSASQYLYQIGLSSTGSIYFRNGYAEKSGSTWGAAFSDGYWNRLVFEDNNGDATITRNLSVAGSASVTGNITLARASRLRLDAGGDAYITRGSDTDYDLYICAGHGSNGTSLVLTHYATSGLCPNSTNDNANLGADWCKWHDIYLSGVAHVDSYVEMPINGGIRFDSNNGYIGYNENGNGNDAELVIGNDNGTILLDTTAASQGGIIFDTQSILSHADILVSGTHNLGSSSAFWENGYIKKWYPNHSDTTKFVEYDTIHGCFRIHGNLVVDGQIAAGGIISNS